MGFELHIKNINNLTYEIVNDRPILKITHRPKKYQLCAVTCCLSNISKIRL